MHGQVNTVIDWDTVWKIEKYPLWVKEGEVGKYWDIKTSEHYGKMVCTKSIKENTLQQIEDLNLRKFEVT